jgi:putative colanic acid biosynthesis glycosyltransferase
MTTLIKYLKTGRQSNISTRKIPLISIITVVKNGVESIAETIKSVSNQVVVSYEHIIIDGASTDGTLDVISILQHDRLHCISREDAGIYDAMNQGISVARGEWIIFIGADDILSDASVLSDVFSGKDLQKYDLICGESMYSDGRVCHPQLNWRTLVFNTLHHQAVFYNRRLLINFKYRTDIAVIADYELNLYAYLHKSPILYLDRQIAVSGIFGVSNTSSMVSNCLDAFKIRRIYVSLPTNISLLILAAASIIVFKLKRYYSILV